MSSKTVKFNEKVNVLWVPNDEVHILARQDSYWKKKCEFKRFCVVMHVRLSKVYNEIFRESVYRDRFSLNSSKGVKR